MPDLCRFGISLPKHLIGKFDKLIRERNYTNRSKALGDLIRQIVSWRAIFRRIGEHAQAVKTHVTDKIFKLLKRLVGFSGKADNEGSA